MSTPPSVERISEAVCEVMEMPVSWLSGKTTPRTPPRLQWTRNVVCYVANDLGHTDGAVSK